MYNNNQITAEIKIVREPERSNHTDVVKAGGAIFQGKKEDGKDPMWVDVQGWKYTARCIENLQKGDTVLVTGSLSEESWQDKNDGSHKSKRVITCETVAKKVWAEDRNQQHSNQGGYQQQPPQQQEQFGNVMNQQGGGHPGTGYSGNNQNYGGDSRGNAGGFSSPPDDD